MKNGGLVEALPSIRAWTPGGATSAVKNGGLVEALTLVTFATSVGGPPP